jgi:hypothetical protein
VIEEASVVLYESTFSASMNHLLKLSTILDSRTTLHIFNDLSQFINFHKAPRHHILMAGDHEVLILGYRDIHIGL